MSFELRKLEDVCDILDHMRIPITSRDRKEGPYPYYGANGIQDYIDDFIFDDELVLLAEDGGNFGSKEKPIAYRISGKTWVNNHAHVLKPKNIIDIDYLCYSLMYYDVSGLVNGATRQKLTQSEMRKINIRYRSLEKQRQMVFKIKLISNIISSREHQLSNLNLLVKSRFIEMFGDPITNTKMWPVDKVEAVCSNIYGGGTPSKSKEEYWNGDIPWISSKDMKSDMISDSQIRITNLGLNNSSAKLVPMNSVIMVIRSGILKHTLPVAINTVPVTVNQDLKVFIPGSSIHYRFLAFLFKMLEKDILAGVRAVTADNIEFDTLKNRKIILPPVQFQNQFASFVAQVDKSKLAIQQSLDELETLKKSLMQQYFG